MSEDSKGVVELCGVRIARGGPVIYADRAGHQADPFQLVIVALPERETTGMVVIGTRQIAGNAAGADPSGRIVRLAAPDEIGDLQTRADLAKLREAGLPFSGSDWLMLTPGGEPSVAKQPGSEPAQGSARAFIDRLFGTRHGG
jgi:hypothetical protein